MFYEGYIMNSFYTKRCSVLLWKIFTLNLSPLYYSELRYWCKVKSRARSRLCSITEVVPVETTVSKSTSESQILGLEERK